MQAVILIGGLGTRLRALFPDRPKALVPILGRPYLDRLIEWITPQGITSFHLACGYRADIVADWLEKRPPGNVHITMSVEPELLGTGGGLKFVEPHIRGETFLAMNGDSFLPLLELKAMRAAHQNSITMAVTRTTDAGRYGTVEFDAQRRLSAFHEKAQRDAGWVNGGVYLIQRNILALVPEHLRVSLETDIFPALAAAGKIKVFTTPPPLLDIGTPEGLAATEKFFRST